ncbi:MAG TPA: GNAT family N-acetyltransferase [Gemmatimonadaceae bacterium]
MSPAVEVVRTYLELRSLEQLRPAHADDRVRFVRRDQITVDHYRRLYRDVGEQWHWSDRTKWSDERLTAHLARSDIHVWECLVDGETAGFFELEHHPEDGSVEISYFGLMETFFGRGIGKAMLTRAAEEAWALSPTRVWLHTCTLDSPHALPNYTARGFDAVRTERYLLQLP